APQARMPRRSAAGNGARLARSATSSIPAASPYWRISPTQASPASEASAERSRSIVAGSRSRIRSRSKMSSVAGAAAAAGWVPGVGVAVEEGPALDWRSQERLEHPLGGEGGGHRQVAAGQALGEAEEVRLHTLAFGREHPARPAEARGDLVEDEQRTGLAGHL